MPGLSAARARGRMGGRSLKLGENQKKHALELCEQKKLAIEEICNILGIGKSTLYRYLLSTHEKHQNLQDKLEQQISNSKGFSKFSIFFKTTIK